MTKPKITEEAVLDILQANSLNVSHAVWVAIRGYYLDSMGVKGVNDRNIWDDAWILYSPMHGILTYRANTDPTRFRPGTGIGTKKGMAQLATGIWTYGPGLHKGRPAFRQCGGVLVMRDSVNGTPYEDFGSFGINIHDARGNSTSSLGCQTMPTSEFMVLRELFVKWLEECKNPKGTNDWGFKVRTFKYVLLDETEIRKGNLVAPQRRNSVW